MTQLVLDVSVTMAWHFEDEATPETWDILHHVRDHGAVVPALWPLEVANVLVQATRRNRTTVSKADGFVAALERLPIVVDPDSIERIFPGVLPLARAHAISAYDAAYLELAIRHGGPLATKDTDLIKAAHDLGIAVRP